MVWMFILKKAGVIRGPGPEIEHSDLQRPAIRIQLRVTLSVRPIMREKSKLA